VSDQKGITLAVTARILAARLDGVAADIRTARWALYPNLGPPTIELLEKWANEISTEAVYLWKYAAAAELKPMLPAKYSDWVSDGGMDPRNKEDEP
jgi:hypothetical protein